MRGAVQYFRVYKNERENKGILTKQKQSDAILWK